MNRMKRVEALEANNPKTAKLTDAFQNGIISLEEYQFAVEHDGMNIPLIAWLDHEGNETENTKERKYRQIMQRIGVLPIFSWKN